MKMRKFEITIKMNKFYELEWVEYTKSKNGWKSKTFHDIWWCSEFIDQIEDIFFWNIHYENWTYRRTFNNYIMRSWNEFDAYENMLTQFASDGKIVAVVSYST